MRPTRSSTGYPPGTTNTRQTLSSPNRGAFSLWNRRGSGAWLIDPRFYCVYASMKAWTSVWYLAIKTVSCTRVARLPMRCTARNTGSSMHIGGYLTAGLKRPDKESEGRLRSPLFDSTGRDTMANKGRYLTQHLKQSNQHNKRAKLGVNPKRVPKLRKPKALRGRI